MTIASFKNLSTDNLSHLNLLNQLPGMLGLVCPNRRFIYCNSNAAYTLGYKSMDQAIGTLIDNTPCKASECTETFAGQNDEVIKTEKPMKIIDIHPYTNDEVMTFLVEKTPFRDSDNNIIGSIFYGTEINHSTLSKICSVIALSDSHYRKANNCNQRSYRVGKEFKSTKLTNRELECLYYLVRGKTSAAISDLLGLSKRTVEHYIDNIKIKMHCDSKSALIEQAIENNFIDFIPESILKNANLNLSVIII